MSTDDECWKPSASIADLQKRARIVCGIREFLHARGYYEVETPIMARHGVTDVYLRNLSVAFRGHPYFLQTSPEYHMKRLLAAGSGSIYQLARVFRDDELGRWHNPEFTLLEWYKLGADHHAMMDEVDVLLQSVLQTKPMLRKTYQEVFLEVCALDPLRANVSALRACLKQFDLLGILPDDETDPSQYFFLLMSHVVEPSFANSDVPIAVFHFPKAQASLAKIQHDVAERFEVYFKGVELANGFHELTDVELQRARFNADNVERETKGLVTSRVDEYLLSALSSGLPSCSGVALGIDRLMALALNKTSLQEAMAFDFTRS